MNKYVLSVDAGKFALKSTGRNSESTEKDIKNVSFRAKMYDLEKGFIDVEGNSYKVELDGKTYIVGEQGEETDKDTSKTSLIHKLCAYTAISQYIEPDTKDNEIYIVLACPISVLKSEGAKEEYKEYIKGDGPIKIKINDKNYSFEIKDITIKAEGSGIVYLEPALFKNQETAVVDFGGLNMNVCIYKNGVAVPSSRFTEEHGSSKLTRDVSDELTAYKKGNIVSMNEAEKALEDGFLTEVGKPDKDSSSYITAAKNNFVNDAIKLMKERGGIDIKRISNVVFVGGTTQKIKDNIKTPLPHATISEDSQWTTSEGLYKVACAKYLK